jgi:hypothetical protein
MSASDRNQHSARLNEVVVRLLSLKQLWPPGVSRMLTNEGHPWKQWKERDEAPR